MLSQWNDKILNVKETGFEELALEIFRFQYEQNIIYRQYADALGIQPGQVRSIAAIPFLPIRFFKSHDVRATSFEPEIVFESSGTTGSVNSRHLIKNAALYEQSFRKGFELFYGSPADWCIIGLLPSYLERKNSSLVYMVNELIKQSHHPSAGFYLNEWDRLAALLEQLESRQQKTLLIGVTFALLDFSEKYSLQLDHTIIMETGGMKGRREELIREDVHERLKRAFHIPAVHSEYGMTELLSQAYSKGNGQFHCPPWMKMLLRDEEDPLHTETSLSFRTGAINIIDLANIYSCSFIATEDAGRFFPDGSFEVLGRMDHSDLRGCSLMVI